MTVIIPALNAVPAAMSKHRAVTRSVERSFTHVGKAGAGARGLDGISPTGLVPSA